jgi:hypothetical protein
VGAETGADTGISADGITAGPALAPDGARKDIVAGWAVGVVRPARWVFRVERGEEWVRECSQGAGQEWAGDSAPEWIAAEWWVLRGL